MKKWYSLCLALALAVCFNNPCYGDEIPIGFSISGHTLYSSDKLPNVKLELRSGECEGNQNAPTTIFSDITGYYEFPGLPAGEYCITAYGPTDEHIQFRKFGITVNGNEVRDLCIPKNMTLISPPGDTFCDCPTIEWEAIAEAHHYDVSLYSKYPWGVILEYPDIEGTSVSLNCDQLNEGEEYTLIITATDDNRCMVGYLHPKDFTYTCGEDPIIIIDGCNTGVPNKTIEGKKMLDLILACAKNAKNHGQFVSCVAELTNTWKKLGLISGKDKGAIDNCAGKAKLP